MNSNTSLALFGFQLILFLSMLSGCQAQLFVPGLLPGIVGDSRSPDPTPLCDLASSQSPSAFAQGTGTPADPYVICTQAQLYLLASTPSYWTNSFSLQNHLDLADYDGSTLAKTFPTIGNYDPTNLPGTPFSGTFDGGNYTLSNFSMDQTATTSSAGLFGYVANATLSKIHLNSITISGTSYVGGLVGLSEDSKIDNIQISGGTVSGTTNYVGGLVGSVSNPASAADCSITNASTNVAVSGQTYVGGLAGGVESTGGTGNLSILDSNSRGSVTSTGGGNYVGGLVGLVQLNNAGAKAHIERSFATGAVSTSGGFLGGLTGAMILTSIDAAISASYATGNVTSTGFTFSAGGLVGSITVNSGSVSLADSHASGDVNLTNGGSTANSAAGLVGALTATNTSTVQRCWASGNVTSDAAMRGRFVGGLFGNSGSAVYSDVYATGNVTGASADDRHYGGLFGIFSGTVTNAFATGQAQATTWLGSYTGGFVGQDAGGTYTNAYWNSDTNTLGRGNSGGPATGITGVTNAQLYLQATFTGFDFTNIWVAPSPSHFPSLR